MLFFWILSFICNRQSAEINLLHHVIYNPISNLHFIIFSFFTLEEYKLLNVITSPLHQSKYYTQHLVLHCIRSYFISFSIRSNTLTWKEKVLYRPSYPWRWWRILDAGICYLLRVGVINLLVTMLSYDAESKLMLVLFYWSLTIILKILWESAASSFSPSAKELEHAWPTSNSAISHFLHLILMTRSQSAKGAEILPSTLINSSFIVNFVA